MLHVTVMEGRDAFGRSFEEAADMDVEQRQRRVYCEICDR
jgi:hypothetical protein